MKTNLFIVESSTKCKTISKYLSSPEIKSAHGSFIVMASNGHIRDLVQKSDSNDPVFEHLQQDRYGSQ